MVEVLVHIVSPVDINKKLMEIERARGAQIMRFALLMERVEDWAIDDIRTDPSGYPVGVNDDMGTAEERLQSVVLFEDLLNSESFVRYLRRHEETIECTSTDLRLIEAMALLRTSRCVVCLNYLSVVAGGYIVNWLKKIDRQAGEGNVLAHVLKERLVMLQRANLIRAVFSIDSVKRVVATLGEIKS